jgi:hypothetical protein
MVGLFLYEECFDIDMVFVKYLSMGLFENIIMVYCLKLMIFQVMNIFDKILK